MFVKSLMICGLFAFCSGNSLPQDALECPQICPDNYEPLCATNGKMFKEFSNNCELKASNCRLQRFDLQTYVATAMDWCNTELVDDLDNLAKKLNNLDLETPECLTVCPLIYSPVCISNGKYRTVMSNECMMKGFNCALANRGSSDVFKVLKHGSC